MQNLAKEWKHAPEAILQQANCYNILILYCGKESSEDTIKVFSAEFFFTNIFNDINHDYRVILLKNNSLCLFLFFITLASYCYYGKVGGKMRIAIVSQLLKYFYSFSVAELNKIESEDKEDFHTKSDYGVSDDEDV